MRYSKAEIESNPEELSGLISYHPIYSHNPEEYWQDGIDLHRDPFSEISLKKFQELILINSGLSLETVEVLLEWTLP